MSRESQMAKHRDGRGCRYPFRGQMVTVAEAARMIGVSRVTLWSRMKRGMSFVEAVTMPLQPSNDVRQANGRRQADQIVAVVFDDDGERLGYLRKSPLSSAWATTTGVADRMRYITVDLREARRFASREAAVLVARDLGFARARAFERLKPVSGLPSSAVLPARLHVDTARAWL